MVALLVGKKIMKLEKNDKFLPFGAPDIGEEEIKEVVECLKSGWLGTGPRVKLFEKNFKEFKNINNAVALNSCTSAIFLSLTELGIGPGDEVITTPMTFCSTINSIIHCGATPVLADINIKTMNIEPEDIKNKITSKTKAILPVHFAGRMCDMNKIMQISKKNSLYVIEDCAHAIESMYEGKNAGTIGDMGCFSFYATKNIVTGEGGMIISKDNSRIDRIRKLALHGMSLDAWKRFGNEGYKHYSIVEAGYKFNMMDIQASIGIHQLAKVEKNWLKRKKIWDTYQTAFKEFPFVIPSNDFGNSKHAYHLFTIRIDEKNSGITRDEFLNKMLEYNIGCGIHYTSIPAYSFYKEKYKWSEDAYPNSKIVGEQTVSLPLSPKLNDSNINYIIDVIKLIFSNILT